MRLFLSMAVIVVIFLAATQLLRCQLENAMVLDRQPDRLITYLNNGLIVIAQRIPTAPVVSVHCWVKTGSIYEQQHNGAGLSHFLEHLVSGGTTTTRSEEESGRLLGMMGAQTNAATSLDTVRYYINTSSQYTQTAIDLMSDWMLHSTITQAEYEREQQVIQREFDMGRGDPGRIFWKLTQQTRYDAHPARHPTIGYLDEFMKVTRDEIYDFYKLMYVPNNMVFVVTGDIDVKAVTQQVHDLWKDAEPGELPELSLPIEPPVDRPRAAEGEADIQLPRLRLAWPGTKVGGEHDYALDLLATVLGGGELSRLVKSVRNEQQLVTQISAYNASFTWGQGFFGIDAVTTPDKLDKVRDAVLAQIQRIKDEGVTEDELARTKAKTLASIVFASQTAQAAASRLATDVISTGNPDYLTYYANAIEKITPEDLRAAAKAILIDDRLMTITLKPKSGDMAQLARVSNARTFDEYETVDLDNRRLIEKIRQVSKAGSGGDIRRVSEPMRLVTLDNGLRVLIERDSRLPIVSMQWYHLGGLLADEPGQEGVANAMATMMKKGAGGLSADEITAQLETIGARLSTECGSNTIYVNSQCLSQHWQQVLGLMADTIIRPDFPAEQWELLQPRLLAAIKTARDRWSSEMVQEFDARYYGDHPWAAPVIGREQVVANLTPNRLRAFHHQHLTANNGVLAIVGDVDPDQVEAEVAKLFGQLPMSEHPIVLPAATDHPTGLVEVQTGKPLCAVQIGYAPGMSRDSEDYAAMMVMTRIVSSFPTGWIHKALRGDGPGLVYAAWAFNRTGVVPGYWSMAFNTQPATAPEAINRCLAIVDRLKNDEVDAEELARAKTSVLVGEAMGRQSCSQRAAQGALDELYGVGFASSEQFLRRINQVSPQEVRTIAGRYLIKPLILVLSIQPIDADAVELK